MIVHNLEQGTKEWLKLRLGKFTASTASAIKTNGKGLETLIFEKMAELLTQKQLTNFKSDAMERGNELEAEAREIYELTTGLSVKEVGFCELNEFVGASPDGLVGEDGLVEIKCPIPKTFVKYLVSGKVDPKYYAQMQFQLYVTDRKFCDYVVYHPDFPNPVITKKIERDEAFIEKIRIGLESGIRKLNELMEKIK